MPILATPPPEPDPQPVLTDGLRALLIDEMRDHMAPSTFDAAMRSLRARDYPLDLTAYITTRSN